MSFQQKLQQLSQQQPLSQLPNQLQHLCQQQSQFLPFLRTLTLPTEEVVNAPATKLALLTIHPILSIMLTWIAIGSTMLIRTPGNACNKIARGPSSNQTVHGTASPTRSFLPRTAPSPVMTSRPCMPKFNHWSSHCSSSI